MLLDETSDPLVGRHGRARVRVLVAGVSASLLVALSLGGCGGAPTRGDLADADGDAGIADALPKVEPKSKLGNMASYVVFGKRYYTEDSSRGHLERGTASWYGEPFHGRKTSSGERYDMYQMTAAHKTLPLPCYVQVTNLENGRHAVVKVNDRGPFHGDRVIDLSYAAAKKLGVLSKGTARVEVKSIDPRDHGGRAPSGFEVVSSRKAPPGRVAATSETAFGVPAAVPEKPKTATPKRARSQPAPASRVALEPPKPVPSGPPPEAALALPESPAPAPSASLAAADDAATPAPSARLAVADDAATPVLVPGAAQAKAPASAPEAEPAHKGSGGSLYLQVGAFGDKGNAEQLRHRLLTQVPEPVHVRAPAGGKGQLYKVQVGPLSSRSKAGDVSQKLAALGLAKPMVVWQ